MIAALVLTTAGAAGAVELQLGTSPQSASTRTTQSSIVVRERASAGRVRQASLGLIRYTRERRSADELAASTQLHASPGLAIDLQGTLASGADFIAERGAGIAIGMALPWGLGLRTALARHRFAVDTSTTTRTNLSGGFGPWRLGLEAAQELGGGSDNIEPRGTAALAADLRYGAEDWAGVLRARHGRLPERTLDGRPEAGASDDTGIELTLESPHGLAGTVTATRPALGLTRTTLRVQLARRF